MTVQLWVLLAFAAWTLIVLGATVGVYRWTGILTGRARFETFAKYKIEGAPWYQRALRAHANCVENLPVYGAIVVVLEVAAIRQPALDVLALVLIGVRIPHTIVHVAFEQTNNVVMLRSLLFITQWVCMVAMVVLTVLDVLH